MAIFEIRPRMVFWEIRVGGMDFTDILKEVVSSIKIRKVIGEPTECEINITSKCYVEDLWVENMPLQIKMGYDRFSIPIVFEGMVKRLPSGQAKELLNYRIEAVGYECELTTEQKVRSFSIPSKMAVVSQIAQEHGLVPSVSIENDIIDYMPLLQRGETDYDFLWRCANSWNCLFWLPSYTTVPTLCFYDAESCHEYGDFTHMTEITWNDLYSTYMLGYRSDVVKCNVEQIGWTWEVPKGSGGPMGNGVTGANEFGRTVDPNSFRVINMNGQTWELKPEFLRAGLKHPSLFGKYAVAIALAGINRAQASLRTYYRIVDFGSSTHANNIPPAHDAAGFKFEIILNEGDPNLNPPRNMFLYCGSLNPRADTADLPNWMFSYSDPPTLKLNEVEHTFENGMLRTKLGASMGGIPYASPHPIHSGALHTQRGI